MSEIYTIDESVGVIEIHDQHGDVVEILETAVEIVEITSAELVGPAGPSGPQGSLGPQGPIGPQGPYAPTYRQTFSSPSDTWIVQHNFGTYPTVDIYDLDGIEIVGDVLMPDRNTVVVTFDFPMTGIAIVKA